jgi:hypothetical protein
MKTKYMAFAAGLLLIAGCTGVLDKKDLSALPEQEVWNTPMYAEGYVNKLCREYLPGWDLNISGSSDDGYAIVGQLQGTNTSNSVNNWPYDRIRNINILLDKVGTGNISVETQNRLKAQALVLRAWLYFSMVREYSGVPLVLYTQDLKEDLYITRNKTSECINQIVKDLDEAAANLPWKWENADLGRITKAAAIALKARVLLYYASPQFNAPGTRDAARWERAYTANKEAKEQLAANGYELHASFENLWFEEMNKEVVFVKRFNDPEITNQFAQSCFPIILGAGTGVSGISSMHPTLELAEAFPMKDGVSISESPGYDPDKYWKNRDPRFAATIAYNACVWPLIGEAGRRQWTYRGMEGTSGTKTGFHCRKAVNTSYTVRQSDQSGTDWVEIRYAEVLLNFAECAAETGKPNEAIEVLKNIRKRAGIEAGTNGMYGLRSGLSGDALIKAILLERRIEFAFEGKRYWDLRRRRLFESELNGTRRHGRFGVLKNMTVTEFTEFARNNPYIDWETDYTTYFNDETVIVDTEWAINFRENYYFSGIPNEHLERNSKLQQTQGWPEYNGSGLFNPYD